MNTSSSSPADAAAGSGRVVDRRRRTHLLLFATAAAVPLLLATFGLYRATSLGFGAWGMDFTVYWDALHRWWSGGSYYEPWQLEGPYRIHSAHAALAVLNPPTFILLAAPFALLPRGIAGPLWVVVPIVVTAWAIRRIRPPAWSWAFLGLLVAWPPTGIAIATGNASLAATAVLSVALATKHKWIAAFVLLKPSLGPFAVVGIERPSWWLAVVAVACLSIPFGWLWADWLAALRNAEDGGLLYSLPQFPTVALPIVAWASSAWAHRRRQVAAYDPGSAGRRSDGRPAPYHAGVDYREAAWGAVHPKS